MSNLNVSIINNSFDALRYIKPETEAERVLYELLEKAEKNAEYVDDDVDDLKGEIEDLEYQNRKLEGDNQDLVYFFDKLNEAYNQKLGISRIFDVDDDQFLDELVAIIKQNA
jgi:predicted nuclease with TOPRIM domain